MKKIIIIAFAFLLMATLLTGCRRPDAGTTGATNNNPSTSSVVRPTPTITMPGASGSNPTDSSTTTGK